MSNGFHRDTTSHAPGGVRAAFSERIASKRTGLPVPLALGAVQRTQPMWRASSASAPP